MGLSRTGAALTNLLAHPLTRRSAVDDPSAVDLRRQIIADNHFLRSIYADWYSDLDAVIPVGRAPVLELGSATGFMSRYVEGLITSDVLHCSGIDVILDARHLPFRAASLRAIAMTNVLHHLRDVGAFLDDAARCVRPGGVLAMIEPWVTPWSRFVYSHLHSEPFVPDAAVWTLPAGGPMSVANGALPWILFARDRGRFEREHPAWRIEILAPQMPFRYLVSGGVSLRPLLPDIATPICRTVERALSPWARHLGMFALIALRRSSAR